MARKDPSKAVSPATANGAVPEVGDTVIESAAAPAEAPAGQAIAFDLNDPAVMLTLAYLDTSFQFQTEEAAVQSFATLVGTVLSLGVAHGLRSEMIVNITSSALGSILQNEASVRSGVLGSFSRMALQQNQMLLAAMQAQREQAEAPAPAV